MGRWVGKQSDIWAVRDTQDKILVGREEGIKGRSGNRGDICDKGMEKGRYYSQEIGGTVRVVSGDLSETRVALNSA